MTTMYINSKIVGNGGWKLESVKSYCSKKGIELKEAYCIVSTCDYAYTKQMNLENGKYISGSETDHIARAGIM